VNSPVDLVRSISRVPVVGPRIASRAITWIAPYFATISPQITVLEPGLCEVRMKKRRRVQNHLGTVHAIAMCNACELAAGMAMESTLPPTLRWIPRGMTVRYLAKAETDLTATAEIASLADGFSGDVVVAVKVRDEKARVVMEADITMYVTPKKKPRPS
jgi:acyl-coenzyme A thioesterase PaaI-like protein